MSARAKSTTPVVSRSYRPAPNDCAHALELLLKRRKGGPPQTALDDTRGESKHDSRADKAIIPE